MEYDVEVVERDPPLGASQAGRGTGGGATGFGPLPFLPSHVPMSIWRPGTIEDMDVLSRRPFG